ncbi:GNAT family N-acetyltransferase [Pedobacter sp.]|jgi:predicted GNAT family acetyltransferase|uniref:GNAT family N-acetyltransferase n=1 Tax=Pedobacter sp. TaxID=1411316 RepID=UPI002C820734|nr:GNAT family N-acetyltransferase [Pedobacter sp.]HWW41820.1 GNAT family N-acetyltransferase [Pedobacter sp.]
MKIEQENNSRGGYFIAVENEVEIGRMTYLWAGLKIIIDHTEVEPKFSGRGIGKLLVLDAVRYAREKKIKILPLCPFAKSVFNKNSDLADTLFFNH